MLAAAVPYVEKWSAAGHGQKALVVSEACAALGGCSAHTFHKLARRLVGRGRKKRADAGAIALSRDEAQMISAYMLASFRRNGKQLCSVKDALKELRANGAIRAERVTPDGEILGLSESAISNALRAYHLHPEQLNQPTPHTHLSSPCPNHCWQMDASVCVLYYLPKSGAMIREMKESEFYTGKLENFEKIKGLMVIRYLITDHRSGMFRLRYTVGAESGDNACEHLIQCMQKPADARGMLYGVPRFLMVDPGSAQTGRKFRRLCRRLGIELIINKAGNARAKGQVEKGHDQVETGFEHALRLLAHELRGLDDLNRLADLWQRHFNTLEIHSRHGKPRWDVWALITPTQLVLPPSVERCQDLATKDPESRKVNGDMAVSWANEFYSVRHVPGAAQGQDVMVCQNPWRDNELVLVREDADGREIQFPLPHMARDEAGQFIGEFAAVIGENYTRPADTVLDTNRKEVQRLIANTSSQKEAEKRLANSSFVPLAQFAIDPLKTERETELPAVLERAATQLEIDGERIEAPISLIDILLLAREALGRRVTPDEYEFLSRRFANGGTPDQVQRVLAQFGGSDAGAEERKVG